MDLLRQHVTAGGQTAMKHPIAAAGGAKKLILDSVIGNVEAAMAVDEKCGPLKTLQVSHSRICERSCKLSHVGGALPSEGIAASFDRDDLCRTLAAS